MTWYNHQIKSESDILKLIRTFRKVKPLYGAFDTETNGLHIIRCTPFLLVFGFVNPDAKEGHTYTIETKNEHFKDTMYTITHLFKRVDKVVAWNAKFDMHMMHNIGYPGIFESNITDGMIYVRLAHDALSKSQGGVPSSLKDYAKQYLTGDAKDHEKLIRSKQGEMKRQRTEILKEMLQDKPFPKIVSVTSKNWTMSLVDKILGDKVLGIEDLQDELQEIFNKWLNETPDPNDYSNIPIEIIEPYAHHDVMYTLEAFIQTKEIAELRKQHNTIELEENLIPALYRMERVGFAFNSKYALESKERMKNYILKKRERLSELAGKKITVGQHAEIKKIFQNKFHLRLASTGQQVLAHLKIKGDSKAQEFIDTITELRTLEKWYSTYIIRFIEEVHKGRIYTTINQTGAASGRVSSDFQQFPNKPIVDDQGNELFHPRKLIKTTGGKYSKLLYIDYSQIELRIQALYTIMAGQGDRNLCRAYMPYHCFKETDTGIVSFDPMEHLKEWNSGQWKLNEESEKHWKPIDLHTLTTLEAFPHLTEEHEEFNYHRKIGKQTNFACNYGASANALMKQMNFSEENANNLYQAYVKNFPGVLKYRRQVQALLDRQGYVENIYGRRYYGITGHLASNYLIQGSAADFLKAKMIEVDEFLKPFQTRFQMNIHDEMSFELHEDDPPELPLKIQKIMETLPNTLVPIVADLEISHTTWAEKVKYER